MNLVQAESLRRCLVLLVKSELQQDTTVLQSIFATRKNRSQLKFIKDQMRSQPELFYTPLEKNAQQCFQVCFNLHRSEQSGSIILEKSAVRETLTTILRLEKLQGLVTFH